MATTIRLDDETKRRLDDLQARIRVRTGRRLSHASLLREMMRYVVRREREFAGDVDWRPFTPKELRALMRLPVRTRRGRYSDRIDETLYGDEG